MNLKEITEARKVTFYLVSGHEVSGKVISIDDVHWGLSSNSPYNTQKVFTVKLPSSKQPNPVTGIVSSKTELVFADKIASIAIVKVN